MARSARLIELQSRIAELRERSLPRKFNPTGAYPARIFDRTRGFRLLAHAEIEACLEDLGVATVNAAFEGWMVDKRPRATLIALLAFTEKKSVGIAGSLPAESKHTLQGRLDELRNAYVGMIRGYNNGIREKDVLRILLPAGIREQEIDPAWLEAIDAFGRARGSTAHGAGKPQTPPDPASELKTVRAIVNGLIPLDQRLSALQTE